MTARAPQDGPKRRPAIYFRLRDPPRAATRTDLRRSWRPPWADMAPRSAPEPSEPSFGALRAPFGKHLFFIFGDCSTLVSHSFRVMFLFVFACVLVFALCFLVGFEA